MDHRVIRVDLTGALRDIVVEGMGGRVHMDPCIRLKGGRSQHHKHRVAGGRRAATRGCRRRGSETCRSGGQDF